MTFDVRSPAVAPDKTTLREVLPFSRRQVCAKCGGASQDLRYCRLVEHGALAATGAQLRGDGPEHLDTECRDCGYVWYTATTDSP